MPCCGGSEDTTSFADKHAQKHPTAGMSKNRKCRDCFCLLLFTIFWGGMFIVAAYAVQYGDISRFEYGDDYLGNLCGKNNTLNPLIPKKYAMDFTNKQYLYFPSPFELTDDFKSLKRVCLESCPNVTSLALSDMICLYGEEQNITNVFKVCWPVYESTPIFHRCVPSLLQETSIDILQQINAQDITEKVISDMNTSWKILVVCIVGSLVIGFIWLVIMRFCAGIMIWFTIFAGLFLLCGLAAMLIITGGEIKEQWIASNPADESKRVYSQNILWQALTYTGYIVAVLAGICVLITFFNCNRVQLAIKIAEEAGKALHSMFLGMMLFPFIPFFSIVALCVYFVAFLVLASTAAGPVYDPPPDGVFIGYNANLQLKGMMLYHLFGFLWTLNFILGVSSVTISGAIADWYWSFSGEKQKPAPVLRAFGRTIRYSLGSIAFGSIILAIVQFIRVMLELLKNSLKGKENQLARCIITAAQCCLGCFQRFIEFLNKNAYVMIAIYGYSFCDAARRGFELVAKNPLRVSTLTCISGFCLFLGRVFVCLLSTLIAFIWLQRTPGLNFYYIPLLFVAIATWIIASLIMGVYDMAIHTMLFCFIEDEDRNDGTPGKEHRMPDSLRSFLNKNQSSLCCCCC